MPVKRRVAKVLEHRITDDAVAAYRAGDDLALFRALGLKPWDCSPLHADGQRPDWVTPDRWAKAAELRTQLMEIEK